MAELRATGLTDDRAGLVLREESGQEHVLAVDDRLLELVDEATAPEQPAEPAADQDPEQDAPQPSPENEG
ncbi:MAG: DUF3071 domain-containing protein, partial [Micrococcus sp.]|nr:DUF3071 domain-containing protein [Micrococcus sp.]